MNKTKNTKPPKECKIPDCNHDAKFASRGMCGKHYAEEQKEKAAQRVKTEKAKEKKAKLRQKRADSFSKLRDLLDSVFSRYIRLRDTDRQGVGFCIDCGERMEWKEIQNGHFMSRAKLSTRWHEENCAAQKNGCNMFQQGRQYEFGKGLNHKYGAGAADRVHELSCKEKKWSTQELKEMIALYTEKVEKLTKEKDFEPWSKK